MQHVKTVHPPPTTKAYDVRVYNWRVVRVLLAIIFSVASAVPLVGQKPTVAPLPVKPHQFLNQLPRQTPQPPYRQPPQPPYYQPPLVPYHEDPQPPRKLPNLWVVLALSTLIWIIAVKIRRWRKENGRLLPKMEQVPFKDYGEQDVVPPGPLVLDLQLYPVTDPGDQQLVKVVPLVAGGLGQ
jgi:hypothetical protein